MIALSEKQGRINVKTVVEHPLFTNSILFLILLNALLIGLETYPSLYEKYHSFFIIADRIILCIFILELILRIIAYRMHFFKDRWSLFDLVIVTASLALINSNMVTVLRIVRILRVLRTISAFPSLKRLVKALFLSIPAMGSVFFLISVLFYVYAVIGTTLFGDILPEYFGNLHLSILTSFQLFTMDGWSTDIFRPIFETVKWAWLYFISFVLIASYILLNLFFGELVANAQKLANEEEDSDIAVIKDEMFKLKEQNSIMHDKINALLEMSKNKG